MDSIVWRWAETSSRQRYNGQAIGASNEIARIHRCAADGLFIDPACPRAIRNVYDQRAVYSAAGRYHERDPVAAHQAVVRGQGPELGACDLRTAPAQVRTGGSRVALPGHSRVECDDDDNARAIDRGRDRGQGYQAIYQSLRRIHRRMQRLPPVDRTRLYRDA